MPRTERPRPPTGAPFGGSLSVSLPRRPARRPRTGSPTAAATSRAARRLGAALLAALALLPAGVAGAHATLVLGKLVVAPDPPRPGDAATLTIELEDPSLTPILDATLLADILPAEAPDAAPVTIRFEELDTPEGSYRAAWTPRRQGAVTVLVRDQTYRQEEARANVTLVVGGAANEAVPFVLPPTATGPRSIATWLLWLIGLPVAAGVLVTVLVLRGGRGAGGDGSQRG